MRSAPRTGQGNQVLVWCLYGVLLLICLSLGTFIGLIRSGGLTAQVFTAGLLHKTPQEVFGRRDLVILLLGTDEDRAPGGKKIDKAAARSDMMMVARLHFKEKRITGITIPRDTLADLPGYHARRINAYHAIGGPRLAREAVENLLGIKIDRVVVVDYPVFQKMVNMIGGIDIDVAKRLKYTDEAGDLYIDFQPGLQHMNGYQAMCYLRYRKDSDFLRQARQRAFLVAFKQQATKKFLSAGAMINEVSDLTGHAFTDEELATLLLFGKSVGTSNIKLGMLPVKDALHYDLQVDMAKLQDSLKEYELIDDTRVATAQKP
ncbi:MAG TPA: LCP family protein [Fimbriimonadaceae bacterium]|nr:LCP family protein [Fimbriimonadaceae bacterium]